MVSESRVPQSASPTVDVARDNDDTAWGGLSWVAGGVLTLCATHVAARNNHDGTTTAAAQDAREVVCGKAATRQWNNHDEST